MYRSYHSALFIALVIYFFSASQAFALTTPTAPKLKAKSYEVIDFHSGKTIAEKNSQQKLAPASLTKIMTAYIAFQEVEKGNLSLDEKTRVSEKAWRTEGSRMFIEVGKFVSIDELLHGMLVQSGNDATVALAEHIAGDEDTFAQLMNQQAQLLGMSNTHFTNSSGLPDENHYTTAHDLALLTRALIAQFPELYKINAIKEYTYNGITQQNRNKLLWRDSSVDGLKTGHTEDAGYCLVSSAVRKDMRLISVVMGTKSERTRNDDNQALLNYGYRFFKTHLLYKANQPLAKPRIWRGAQKTIEAGLAADLYLTVPRDAYKHLEANLDVNPQLSAPISKGQKIGIVHVMLKGKEIEQRPLVALQGIEKGSTFDVLKDEVLLMLQ
ncbi:MAG: D-alanyl-D-alanine carboxypeptidase [Cycloclasticus sp. symbiont of Poecilosclerida sp. M]|nr:MAG: D-alanyl-D-alanine carboxypeptidase [Cycloclasticus sp. symbiont of Poecilosclerida sp. M]